MHHLLLFTELLTTGKHAYARAELNASRVYRPDEFSRLGVPFGFEYLDEVGSFPVGSFPVFFDTKLSASGAARVAKYLRNGQFIDEYTDALKLQFATYNRQLRVFSFIQFTFTSEDGGNINSMHSVELLSLERLVTDKDKLHFGFEVLVWVLVLFAILSEMYDFVNSTNLLWGQFKPGRYFKNQWNYFDVLSIRFMAVIVGWRVKDSVSVTKVTFHEHYNVLSNVAQLNNARFGGVFPPRALALNPDVTTSDDRSVLSLMQDLKGFAENDQAQKILVVVSAVLLFLRLLKFCHFQTRMGVLMRSLANAAVDLMHFVLLWFLCTMMYSCLGMYLYGAKLTQFSSVGLTFETLLILMVTGEADPLNDILDVVMPEEQLYVRVYFWSYVLVFFYLPTNIFPAIVVEAFVGVKQGFGNQGGSILHDLHSIAGIAADQVAQRLQHEKWEEQQQFRKAEQVFVRKSLGASHSDMLTSSTLSSGTMDSHRLGRTLSVSTAERKPNAAGR